MIEYSMSKKLFNAILDTRTETEKKENPYDFVAKVINEEYGLRGEVSRVIVELE